MEHQDPLGLQQARPENTLIATELKRYNIDIAALSETRLLGEGSLKEEGASYTFFWKGYPIGGQHLHGAGLAIKNCLLPNLIQIPAGIYERLMSIRIPLTGKQCTTLFSAYALTLPSEENVKDHFYEALDEAIHKVPKSDKILLLGDFNVRVGKNSDIWKGVIGQNGIGHHNANGLRLLSLCA